MSQSRSLPLRRLLAAGVPLAILLAAALGPPVSHDWSALAVKSGKDVVSLEALGRATMMLAGTRHPAVAGLVAALAVAGVVTLQRRSPPVRRLVRYLLACCVLLAVAVIASGAMYIHHPLVLARYLLPFLPLLCWFAGEGAVAIAGALAAAGRRAARDSWPQSAEGSVPRPLPAAALAIAGVGALALQGPLPVILAWPNQFIGHLRYQFDYDPRWNPYERLAVGIDIPGFYRELARRPPMSTAIVEMPWRLESHYNPLPWYQEVHRQRVMIGMVGGVCGPRSWGEYPPDGRIRFRNFVHLADILAGRPVNAELLVIHRRSWAIDRDTTIEWPDMRGCLPQIVAKLGPPLADDGDLAVFRLAGRLPAGAAPASASPVTAAPASAAPAGLSLPGESPAGFPRGDADDRLRNGRGG